MLADSSRYWAQQLTLSAKSKAPKHIAPYIHSKSTITEGMSTITLNVDIFQRIGEGGTLQNYGTVDALAQEYGHPGATITPKTGNWLAFDWSNPVVGIRRLPDGRVMLKKVTKLPQPAFNEGQGYLRPAMQETADSILASSSKFREAIRLDVMESMNKIGAGIRNAK
jgi:hypothetical protein